MILWVVWKTLADQQETALDQFAKWGVKGIKVDFMQRDDQMLMNFYHNLSARNSQTQNAGGLSRRTARQHDAHLAEPDQHRRRKGMEWSKWSAEIESCAHSNPALHAHVSGSHGFHPGAMLNAHQSELRGELSTGPWRWAPAAINSRCT